MSTDQGFEASEFRCEVMPERDLVRVVPVGELDIATAPVLRHEVEELIDAGFKQLVLDLRETTFMDSTGLAILMHFHEATRRDDMTLSIIPGPPQIEKLLTLTGVADQLTLIRDDPHS